MPSHGIEWCDCGEHHALDGETVLSFAGDIVDTSMDRWDHVAGCGFFLMAIDAAAGIVKGALAPRYPFERGLEIVAVFSKTWQRCPEEICRTVRDRED